MCFWKRKKKDKPLQVRDLGGGNFEVVGKHRTIKGIYFSEAAMKHIDETKKRMSTF